jgi:hypothetical protein
VKDAGSAVKELIQETENDETVRILEDTSHLKGYSRQDKSSEGGSRSGRFKCIWCTSEVPNLSLNAVQGSSSFS